MIQVIGNNLSPAATRAKWNTLLNRLRLHPVAIGSPLAYAQAGGFGLEWMWTAEPCAQWRDGGAPDRYTGPWNRPTANPILLLGNTGDAALPYEDSVAMSHDLARAQLLTVEGYGHTEASNPSTCALDYETSYMLTGALPPAGTVCKENLTPFSAQSGG